MNDHTLTIRDVADVSGGLTKNAKRDSYPGRRPYLTVANVYANRLQLDDVGEIGITDAEVARVELAAGDLLVVEGNGSLSQLGRVALWSGAIPGCVHQNHLIKVRPRPKVTSKWLLYWLLSPKGRAAIEAVGSSTSGLHTLSISKVESLPVVVRPLDEQHRIVAAIETHFSRLDAAVASLTRAKANVKRARASVLKAAVEGRLVPTEAALARAEGRDYEPAAVRVARVEQPPRPNRYKTRSTDVVPGHAALSVGDTQAALPEGWTRAPMVEVARMESGHTPSRSHPEWWDGDVPWIGIADAREHHGGVTHDTEQHTNADGLANSAARLLPAGTVCISRTASVGYVVVMGRPMATSQDFVDWICTDALDPHWVRVVFLADRDALLRFGKGSVHKTIYFPELLSLHIAIPPLAEQHRIVAEVDRRLSVLDALDATLDANLARCDRLRQAVLKRAFEGRLVPAEADAPLLAAEPQMTLFAQDARS